MFDFVSDTQLFIVFLLLLNLLSLRYTQLRLRRQGVRVWLICAHWYSAMNARTLTVGEHYLGLAIILAPLFVLMVTVAYL
ncbi:MAG: hypothetical protein AAF409_07480 [Pseudomonadota bacterium]